MATPNSIKSLAGRQSVLRKRPNPEQRTCNFHVRPIAPIGLLVALLASAIHGPIGDQRPYMAVRLALPMVLARIMKPTTAGVVEASIGSFSTPLA